MSTDTGYLGNLTSTQEAALERLRSEVSQMVLDAGHNKDDKVTLWNQDLCPCPDDQLHKDARDIVLLKFLRAREFDVDKARSMMVNCLKWRREADIQSIINMKVPPEFEGHDSPPEYKDKEGRPILLTTFGTMDPAKVFGNVNAFVRYRVMVFERAIAHLSFRRGEAETLLQIHDYTGVPMVFQESSLKKAVNASTHVFADCYPEFKGVTIFANFPTPFVLLFKAMSVFIPAKTYKKFQLANASQTPSKLSEYIHPGVLDPRYGGLRTEKSKNLKSEGDTKTLSNRETADIRPLDGLLIKEGDEIMYQVRAIYGAVYAKVIFQPSDGSSEVSLYDSGDKEIQPTGEGAVIEGTYKCEHPGNLVIKVHNIGRFSSKIVAYRAEKI
ncbi:hypothetical protein FOL47_001510 [Perkinsus chesapeaki]|uniref:CRAL-TRIO domain-containing protein n=1 Tax=Perkinsus chesapeaki TaxID=330153 RepID=A0A7J6KRT4_PERCH|nr:hypothetical protein FOL47_001510 [Perkinsus chesapeaki]